MTSSTLVWESLARNNREVTRTPELKELARSLGKEPRNTIDHLVRGRYLVPLFKGTYHVSHPEEIRLGVHRHSHLELFALAAESKNLGRWYFGLETALRLHGLSQEYRREETVIAEKLYRALGINIAGHRFVVHKWNADLLTFGVERKGRLYLSDPEKTALDLIYRDYWSKRRGREPAWEGRALLPRLSTDKLNKYLKRYPDYIGDLVVPWI